MKIKTYLIEVHIISIEESKNIKYLLLKRSSNQKYPNIWQMVTGKVDNGELAYQTAKREVMEETNLDLKELYVVPNINSFYDSADNSITHVPVFVGTVEPNSKVKISTEHSEYKWTSAKEAKKLLAWPGQEKSVKIINQYFTKQKNNLNFIKIF